MSWFKKENKIQFVKTVEMKHNNVWETWYHTEIDKSYVSNSGSQQKEIAEAFFEKLVKNNGLLKTKEVIREETVTVANGS